MSQTDENDNIIYPRPFSSWELKSSIGATVTFVPRPIAEEEIRQIPSIDIRARMGLVKSFSIIAGCSSNYITNSASLGLQLNTEVLGTAVGIGDKQSVWYGIATLDGFDIDALGWFNSPFVKFGIDAGKFRATIGAEVLLLTYRTTRAGEVEISTDANRILGGAVSITIEQKFVKNTSLILELKINSLTNAYQSWLAFSTFGDRLLYPEFSLGVVL